MTFRSDLSRLIHSRFEQYGVSYEDSMALDRLAARYFEMTIRHIQPGPRRVHFSDQTHASLGDLSRRGVGDNSARDARRAVFRLRQILVEGGNVNGFLSKNIRRATSWDGLLWQYGMHHFHLGRESIKDGFVNRSDYLLFAIVAPEDVFFVDVRLHPPRGDGIKWVSQNLLRIVHANWPDLIEAHVLHGVRGDRLKDEEMYELRRKNTNYAMDISGNAIAPLRGGLAGDGSSVLCTIWAMRLLKELKYHGEVLRNAEVRRAVERDMRASGFSIGPKFEFELVFVEDLDTTPELMEVLTAETCISRDLCRLGFAIVEQKTRSPIAIHDTGLV